MKDNSRNILKKKGVREHTGIDILFEHRNKAYGAYILRKQYNRRLGISFAIACASVVLLLLAPFIISYFHGNTLNNEDFETAVVIDAPIPKGFVTPEYLPPPPPPERKKTAPKVVKDKIPIEKKQVKPKPAPPTPPLTQNIKSKDSLQNKPSAGKINGDPDQITIEVDDYPSWASHAYRGFEDYFQKNIKMPEIDRIMKHYGTVVITATINRDGSISNVFVSKGVSPGLNAEALRVVKEMPKLNPAIYHHKPVKTYMKFPVIFLPPSEISGK